MNEIFNSVMSPSWWFSTIVIAVLVNIISSYAKPMIDQALSNINAAWRNRTQTQTQKFNDAVSRLVRSPIALAEASEKEVRARLEEISFTLLEGFLVLVMLNFPSRVTQYSFEWFLLNLLSVLLFVGLYRMVEALNEAKYQSRLIRIARSKIADEI